MLSTKSSVSAPSSSRKYSAIVNPVSPTRARAPGGSFIWPKTSAVCGSTPASCISTYMSLPSREHRAALVLVGDVADELLHDDRLARAGASEQPNLRALGKRADQVDDLD